MGSFDYLRPETVDDAVEALQREGARAHSGGTDLLSCLRDGVLDATSVVSLTGLDELRGIERTKGGGLRIGALTTIARMESDPTIRELYPGLAGAASEVASPQLRNQGTLGGNLCQKPRCWYYRGEFHCLRKGGSTCFARDGANAFHCIFGGDLCYIVHPSDTAAALVALEARARIKGPGGSRWIPVEELHVPPSRDPRRETVLDPGEVLVAVEIPPPEPGLRSSYRKVRARRAWDFALAGVALALVFDGPIVNHARVVLSGAAPVPWRSRAVEELVVGRVLDEETLERARDAVVAEAEPLNHNGYKIPLFRAVIHQELSSLAEAG